MHVKIDKLSDFGKTVSGSAADVFLVVLGDEGRMSASLLSYGATLCRLMVPDQNGILENVVLGYENYCDYEQNPLYAGATLGPNAGRISGAALPVGGSVLHLSENDGHHNLHGGFECASFQNWTVASYSEAPDSASVTFSLDLPDGLDGFPGNRTLCVCYTLKSSLRLEIVYQAVTDRPAYFNLSNHSYFNLSGDFTRSGLEQELHIPAARYLANDEEHIPTELCPCAGTPFDYSVPSSLVSRMQAFPDDPQLKNACGYNNAFLSGASVTSGTPGAPETFDDIEKALSLKDNASGRHLTLCTDAPAIVLYSGGYIGGSHTLAGNIPSSDSCAIALEAQDIPDVPHIAPGQYHLTAPGEVYCRTILYAF